MAIGKLFLDFLGNFSYSIILRSVYIAATIAALSQLQLLQPFGDIFLRRLLSLAQSSFSGFSAFYVIVFAKFLLFASALRGTLQRILNIVFLENKHWLFCLTSAM